MQIRSLQFVLEETRAVLRRFPAAAAQETLRADGGGAAVKARAYFSSLSVERKDPARPEASSASGLLLKRKR
ncbi:MAG TPA: hypothetical protein PKI19_08685 [Elusimicrobiales bacterium]|nr:hypothetical protein [Elusimicrobiales bacterium]